MAYFKSITCLLLATSLNGCIMINKGLQSVPGIAIAAIGIALIYAGLRMAWSFMGKTDVPPSARFLSGLIAGIMILLA